MVDFEIKEIRDLVLSEDKRVAFPSYTPDFCFDIALRYDPPEEVCERHGVSQEEFMKLLQHKPFMIMVRKFQKEITETGVTFKMKAQMLAEDLLGDAYAMAKDDRQPATVRATIIQNVVKWAGYEVKDTRSDGVTNNFQINIDLA